MGHFEEGYRLKCESPPRFRINESNIYTAGTSGEKDQMEVVVSPPPVSSYTLPRGSESPPGIQSIMYSPRSVIDSAINPCHVQIKTEQEAINFSSNRNLRCARKETHLSPRFVTNGARALPDYQLSAKLGLSQAFTMSPSEKKNSPVNVTNGCNPDGYLFGKALENSMENLMKFAEVLYKCTLCTTLPSILTSRDSFISHVNDLHLTKKQSHKECQHCNLKFSTEEDLRAHCRFSHGMESHLGDEVEPTEPSPIDEFTNKSETEINTENQCTVGDPTKTIKNRTSRFIMESVHAKQRQAAIVPSSPLIRVTNCSSPGKETVKSEKVSMEENISRLQQLADQILISNTRLSSGGAGASGTPSGFHGATSNPSYTPDFGKYTKLIREGGNIVYFCQVCNCKCQVRAAFMSHCSSYQHRGRVDAADRNVTSEHSPTQAQSQQPQPNQSTQAPPPAHSHPHSQRHQQNSHPTFHHQQSHQLLLTQSNFKRDHLSCTSSTPVSANLIGSSVSNSNTSASNNNNHKSNSSTNGTSSNSKKSTHYSGQTSSSSSPTSTPSLNTSTSSASTFANTNSSSSSSVTNSTNTSLSSGSPSPISPTEASQTSKSISEDRSAASNSVGPTTKASVQAASPTPDHLHEGSPTSGSPSESTSDCEFEKDGQRKRPRADMSSDGDSNCDREVTTRQRRKRHAPVAVRHPQRTTSWSDSDSEDESVCTKSRKKSSEGESEEEDNDNNNGSNNNNNDDDNNTGSSSTSSSSSNSRDNSHKGNSSSNTSSNNNTGRNSSNNTSCNTIQSSKDTGTNRKNDNEHPQPGDKTTNEDLDSQAKSSPDSGRKTPQSSPQSSPVTTRVPTPENPSQQAIDTPVDFSMTDANCSFQQNTDSLGMLSSVVEGFLVSKNQPPVSFGSFDKSQAVNPLTSIKTEPEERADSDSGGPRGIYRCSFCDFVCYEIRDYEEHFVKDHDPDLLDVTLTDSSGKTVHGEYWKMLKIKDILPELLVGCAKGYVSRDILLQKISLLLNIPEVVHWGPACNKAVREEFPNSLAQRKGKFKKTYYFGVALIEQLQEQEELSDSENVTYQPLRDLAQDLEKILQFLPELVFWTGDLDVGISRDEVLQLLGEKIEETGVQYWGVQCNRAMRFLFPSIHMKRKGKFKTVYFGVDFMKNITRQIPQTFDSDQTMFIKSEPLDDSYDSVEQKSLHPEMSCAIFPTSIPMVVSTSSPSIPTAVTTRSYATGIE